jgi:Conserved oligomeric complex COG6
MSQVDGSHSVYTPAYLTLSNTAYYATNDTNRSSSATVAAATVSETAVAPEAVTVEEALSRVMKGVGRPLQGRVTTVLEDCSDAVTVYKLMGYLAFYCETVRLA